MRDILFRGKRTDTSEWVEGNLVLIKNYEEQPYQCFIISQLSYLEYGEFDEMYQVFPETVGQFAGLTDKNGKKIFEGDIVKYKANATYLGKFLECIGQVKCNKKTASYAVSAKDNIGAKYYDYFPIKCEVIGNIHDNPELLTAERNE